MLKLTRVVDMHDRLVAGIMHNLTLEIDDAGNKKIYQAKVWVKPWMDFKELREFTLVEKRVIDTSGYQSVPVHDPVVQDAANYVLKEVHPVYPYESQEVVHAKAEMNL
ncbi:cysteine proteinase inhibitor 12-like [Bidens hawaiensis]|uniref:cysteine proteinase inhibitor 12-like n=1 Tax=Bidens hawaiensis TaxID=980011 RepID=UPI004049C98E